MEGSERGAEASIGLDAKLVDLERHKASRVTKLTLSSTLYRSLVLLEQSQYPIEDTPGVVADRRGAVAVRTFPSVVIVIMATRVSTTCGLSWAGREITTATLNKTFFQDLPTAPSVSNSKRLLRDKRVFFLYTMVVNQVRVFRVAGKCTCEGDRFVRTSELHEEVLCSGGGFGRRRQRGFVPSREHLAWATNFEFQGLFFDLIFERWRRIEGNIY